MLTGEQIVEIIEAKRGRIEYKGPDYGWLIECGDISFHGAFDGVGLSFSEAMEVATGRREKLIGPKEQKAKDASAAFFDALEGGWRE